MRHPRRCALVVTALLVLPLSSCADETEPSADQSEITESPSEPPTSSPATAESTPTAEVDPSPSTVAPSQPEETESATSIDPASLLLPASRVGKLNAEWRWATGNDFDTEPDRLVACHLAPLVDIGAEQVAVREYSSDLDANVKAYQLVAAMPDEKTAQRLYAVLESWGSQCQRRLEAGSPGRDGIKVSELEPVDSGADSAATYVSFQPTASGSARIENVGIARDDQAITVVVMKVEGQDFNYPRGRTPAAVTLRNAAPTG